ncbi:hypothetical protein BGZ73_008759 [Actinomortierella ambigua]|nr:hypothetical protein BGZ73_008759 [Actinomortierella ambigua]
MTIPKNNTNSSNDHGAGSSSSSSSTSSHAPSGSSSNSTVASTTSVTLNIKTLESTTHAVSIQLSKKVADLKQVLHEMLEVPTNRQRLIYRGQLMRDEKVLKDYALEDGHTLHLVTRPEDAPPANQQSGHPRSNVSTAFSTGWPANPLRFTPSDYQVSIIGVDSDIDPQSHLPTIEAELARAAAQLRNVQMILAQPENEDGDVELEPLDLPHLESVRSDVDGDVVEISTLTDILNQLSEANRAMANHLSGLSNRYQHGRSVDVDQSSLQQASVRTARAMYRLASVQNTMFPMLANASFEGGRSGTTNYRYLPSQAWPRPGGDGRGATGARANVSSTARPLFPLTGNLVGHPVSSAPRGVGHSLFPTVLPLPAGMNPTAVSFNSGAALIPSVVAHARATARRIRALTNNNTSSTNASSSANASSSTNPSPSGFNAGPDPIGMLTRGADGNLSYTTQQPRTDSSSSDEEGLAEFAQTALMDFWRQVGGHTGQNSDSLRNTPSSSANAGPSHPAMAAVATAQSAESATRSAEAAVAAVQRVSMALDNAIANTMLGRRRNREQPDDSNGDDARPSRRRRLSDEQDHQRSISALEAAIRHRSRPSTTTNSNATHRSAPSASTAAAAATMTSPRQTSPPPQLSSISRSNSNDSRQMPTTTQGAASPTGASPGSSSPPTVSTPVLGGASSSSSSPAQQSMGSPAYNLGRIGVFISALLRMVDQPREDGSPRTLADVVCNDPDNRNTILQDLITSISESVTIRETRLIVEGYPSPLRNLHPVFNTFIREKALGGRQLTEENMDSVAVMLASGILNAVDFEEILESLTPAARIEISAPRIRQMSAEVLREHFRRLIYMVVAVPQGREASCSTFARDLILWIRDVVGAWRVAFYGLYPEQDHSEAQRIATHVVGSAIHANGRRWVELSNRATNTLVNVLCANIVPRRRGEEQAGGLVGGAWPLMATTSRNRRACVGPSLLGSTSPPYASPTSSSSTSGNAESSSSRSSSSSSTSSLASNLEWARPLPGETPTETQDRIMRRVKNAFMAGERLPPEWTAPTVLQAFMNGDAQGAIQRALAATPGANQSSLSSSEPSSSTSTATTSDVVTVKEEDENKKPDHRTRVEDASDEEMA